MSDPKPKKPMGKGRRIVRLASLTASLAGRYAGTRVKSAFQSAEEAARSRATSYKQSGERIAETLGDLKGAAMKVGQMASVAGDILPRELSSALTKLQKGAPPVPYEVIADQIEAELGCAPELLFEHFDREPFAAASIGQVHRARVDDGREVVVKVQYPGVDSSVDSDLAHLKLALRASGLVQMDRASYNALFKEIRARLYEELDYCNEADNVRLFRKFHQDHPFVVVPDVVGERSSQRILTLTFEDGDHVNDLETRGYSQQARNQIGWNMWLMFLAQLFDLQAIHADPNPANFAFRPDGTIVMYDFGCVKKLAPEILNAYADTAYAGIEEDYDAVHDALDRLGVLRPGGPKIKHEYYKRWRDLFYLPYAEAEEFDYGAATIHDDVVKMIPGVMKRMPSFKMPVELVFIDRVIAGHYANLRVVGSRGPFLDLVTAAVEKHSPLAQQSDVAR
jgi:predicted unusual protein kinase regulating ubiquinone biosynthesis (AarF/ABC1/UbiB family)